MTELSSDDKQALDYLVKKHARTQELAAAAVQAFGDYLCEKYGIRLPDKLSSDGTIIRAPQPGDVTPTVKGRRTKR